MKIPANWPGSLLLCQKSPIFPPLQPDHTGCGGDLQLCHIGDPGLYDPASGDDQLAVLPYPVRSQILPLLAGFAQCVPGGRIGDDSDPQAIGPEREL